MGTICSDDPCDRPCPNKILVLGLVATLIFGLLMPLEVGAETASSRAFAEQTQLSLNVVGVGADVSSTGPSPIVMEAGTNNYGPVQQQTAGISSSLLGGLAGVSTGVLIANTQYDNDNHHVQALGEVADPLVDLNVLTLLRLGLSADALAAHSQVTGHCGQLQAQGRATLTNAVLSVAGTNLPLPISPPPNTPIDVNALGLAGVTLILNEQVITGDGVTERAISVNALRLNLSIDLALIDVSGSIVFGHSESRVQCNTADLSISKQATPDPAVANAPLVYTVRVDNQGPDDATAVHVEDQLPANFNVISVTPSGSGVCQRTGQLVSCDWALIPAHSFASVDILGMPTSAGNLINSADVDTDDHDPNPGNNNITILTVVDPAPDPDPPPPPPPPSDPEADLALLVSANTEQCFPGDLLIFTVQVNNLGPDAATNTQLHIELTEGVTLGQLQIGPDVSCQTIAQGLNCALGAMALGDSRQLSFEAVPSQTGEIITSAQVSSDVPDPVTSNNQDQAPVEVVAGGAESADLVITGVVEPEITLIDDEIMHRLTVLNQGPDPAVNARLDIVLPTELEYLAAAPVEQGSCTNSSAQRVNCELGTLAVGESRQVMVSSLALTVGMMQASGITRSDVIDPVPADNSVLVVNQVIGPDGMNGGQAIAIPTLNPLGLIVMLLLVGAVGWRELKKIRV